jgi:hypothetical protein
MAFILWSMDDRLNSLAGRHNPVRSHLMSDSDISSSRRTYAVPRDFTGAAAIVRSLIETRTFRKERLEEAAISTALHILARTIEDVGESERRLAAVSLLGKAGEISKPIALIVHGLLERGLQSALPPISSWGNADDRYYLAKGISISHAPWVKTFAAVALARGEVVEKASREVWANLALTRADSLAEALQAIAGALSEQMATLDDPTDTAYRKLIRISEALSRSLLTADVPTGEGFGKAFASLVLQAGGGKGAETLKLRDDAAVTVLELLIQILRLRFEVLFDSDLYRAAGTIRRWWSPGRPPEEVERKADRIAELAFKGIHVLARQGVLDKELRQALVTALGQARVNAAGGAVAGNDLSLDPRASHWLATGQELAEARSNEAVREINEQELDELIARLLLAVRNQEAGPRVVKMAADAIDVFEPAQASILRNAAARSELIEQWTNALASRRRLATYGSHGDLVLYDPAVHESAQMLQRSSQVRIAVAGVTRAVEGRPPTILMKALVEKV